jgi:ribosomal protein S18 acetylase RimI-like enzyme
MKIRKADKSDIEQISRMHQKVFDSSYFSVHYPIKLLCKYFESLLSSNEYNYVVFDENQQLLGFLIGGYQTQKAVDDFMSKNLAGVLFCILKNPRFIISGIGKLYRRVFTSKQESKARLRLFLIGVDPTSGKKGAGSLLLSEFEKNLVNDGVNLYGLYVRVNNNNAIIFYERRGFQIEFKRGDLKCYIKNI